MDQRIIKMVTALFPDAIPDIDFYVEVMNESAIITKWNELKLGKNPGMQKIHDLYMGYARKKKEILPQFDATDPLPFLSEKKAFRSVEFNPEPIEVFNGLAFQKRH
jgi:hypothetical protein